MISNSTSDLLIKNVLKNTTVLIEHSCSPNFLQSEIPALEKLFQLILSCKDLSQSS